MISSDRFNLASNQEKFEWVAPRISLMETNQTEGKVQFTHEGQCTPNGICFPEPLGPS